MSEKSGDVVTQQTKEPYGYNEWVEAMNRPNGLYTEGGIEYLDMAMPNLAEYRKNEESVYDVCDWRVISAAQQIIDETRKLAGVDPIIERDKPLPKKESKAKREMKEAVQEVLQDMLEQIFKKKTSA